MNELALFAGAGGGILGGHLLGWRTVCAVEYDAYAASVLIARQNDECLAPFPVWDDVRTFDGRPWRGIVDVVSGGFPCQDISAAGKGAGIDGERSGLWSEMARIIGEVRPRFAFVENSPMLAIRGLGRVLGDLAEMGYDARWGCVSAADAIFAAGNPAAYHGRERIWIAAADAAQPRTGKDIGGIRARTSGAGRGKRADTATADAGIAAVHEDADEWPKREQVERREVRSFTSSMGGNASECGDETRNANSDIEAEKRKICERHQKSSGDRQSNWWQAEPAVGRVVDGMAHRMDRLKCIGNGQVPHVAELAWKLLTKGWIDD